MLAHRVFFEVRALDCKSHGNWGTYVVLGCMFEGGATGFGRGLWAGEVGQCSDLGRPGTGALGWESLALEDQCSGAGSWLRCTGWEVLRLALIGMVM